MCYNDNVVDLIGGDKLKTRTVPKEEIERMIAESYDLVTK